MLFSVASRCQPGIVHGAGRRPGPGPGARRRGVARVARELRRRARGQDAGARVRQEIERFAAGGGAPAPGAAAVGGIRAVFEPVIDAIPNVGIIVLLLVGSWQVSTGRSDPGDLVQAMALFSFLAFPMRVVGFFLQEMPRAVVSVARVDRVLATSPRRSAVDHGRCCPSGTLVGAELRRRQLRLRPGAARAHRRHLRRARRRGRRARRLDRGPGKTTSCDRARRPRRSPTGAAIRVGGVDIAEHRTRRILRGVAVVGLPGDVPVRRVDRATTSRSGVDVRRPTSSARQPHRPRRRVRSTALPQRVRHRRGRAWRHAVGRPAPTRRAWLARWCAARGC